MRRDDKDLRPADSKAPSPLLLNEIQADLGRNRLQAWGGFRASRTLRFCGILGNHRSPLRIWWSCRPNLPEQFLPGHWPLPNMSLDCDLRRLAPSTV